MPKIENNNNSYVRKNNNVSDHLENELVELRTNKVKAFYNFETNCKGVVFIKVDKAIKNDIDIKSLFEGNY